MTPTKTEQSTSQAAAIKDTLIGVVISFVMAFVFRGFVIEGFQIPTGSMAPTLMGKHVRIDNPETGSSWAVGPWDYVGGRQAANIPPLPRQGAQRLADGRLTDPITVNDPALGAQGGVLTREDERLLHGDRIFILKYLRGVHDPERWDVCVFKNPSDQQNFIKRLVGLPGEQIALVDGDVFARDFVEGTTSIAGAHAWSEDGWRVQRKDERTQRAMLQTVFDSRRTPPNAGPSFQAPWTSAGAGAWSGVRESASYTREGAGASTLTWDRPITDWYPYNQTADHVKPDEPGRYGPYPVSDVAMRLGFEPTGDSGADENAEVTALVEARGHEFRGRVGGGRAVVEMRAQGAASWTELDAGAAPAFEPGRTTTVEFWHIDQALWVFVDGDLAAGGPEAGAYELTPTERLEAATGKRLDAMLANAKFPDPRLKRGPLANPGLYNGARVSWGFDAASSFTVHRVHLSRDIHYQLSVVDFQPTNGGDPRYFPTLGPDQYFVCGDNSPSSADSRMWTGAAGNPDPWITDQLDGAVGVVHRDLMLGRAWVVYFPSPLRAGRVPVPIPDLGRVRWIW